MRLVAIVDMATGFEADGRRYEDEVLALLGRHGGTLESRLYGTDGATEVQTISFATREGYESALVDPDRLALRERLGPAAPTTRVILVTSA